MSVTDGNFMGPDPYELREPRQRLGAFLDRQYRGGHKAKLIAADLGCSPKTAENWLAGHWPGSRHWAAIVGRFGADVLDAVFGPDIDQTRARLLAEVRKLEEELESKRAGLRKAGGAVAGDPSGLAALQDGTAVDDRGADRGGR
jgi:hypothetical protein